MNSYRYDDLNENIHENDQQSYIPVITRKETARINTREVFYIETELRVVHVHTDSRIYRFYGKLDDITRYLNDSFYRCHKSCIINLEQIVRMEDGIFHFPGDRTLRVGQNNYRHTRSHYIKYLEQNRTFP